MRQKHQFRKSIIPHVYAFTKMKGNISFDLKEILQFIVP
jgi:hypothetical protein